MLEFVDHRWVMNEKYKRQQAIPELEYHVGGACVHYGKISPGCRQCFTQETGGGIQVGMECMYKCPMCYYDRKRNDGWQTQKDIDNKLSDFFYESLDPNWKPISYSYQSSGETLMYVNQLERFALLLNKVDKTNDVNIYHHLYTNGILADKHMLKKLKNMNVHELRFHLSASGFSPVVISNMYTAAKMGFFVAVEEPSWPPHKKKIIEHLSVFEDIGVKHVNIVEVQITKNNFSDIEKAYSDGKYYKLGLIHLYDGGLVYDIIEETIKKGYHFSVLDCNSAIECYRHIKTSKNHKFDISLVKGMCADWDYGNNKIS